MQAMLRNQFFVCLVKNFNLFSETNLSPAVCEVSSVANVYCRRTYELKKIDVDLRPPEYEVLAPNAEWECLGVEGRELNFVIVIHILSFLLC